MAQHLSEVNWFKFVLVVFMAMATSMLFNLEDGKLETVEAMRTVVQALIAGFAFLQCPGNVGTKRKPTNDGGNC